MSKRSQAFLPSDPYSASKSLMESAQIMESEVRQKTKDLTFTDYLSITLPWTISWIFTSSSGLGAMCPEVEAQGERNAQTTSVNLTPLYVLICLLIVMNLVILGFIISDKFFLFQFRKAITDDVAPLIERDPKEPVEELEDILAEEEEQAEKQAEERAEERVEAVRKDYEPPDPDEFYVLESEPKFQTDTLTAEEYARKLRNKE
jgi:hypothetical protein